MAQQTTADDRTAANLNTADWSSEDWAEFNAHPSENNHYVSTSGNITRHCPRCGYEGTHDHPRRSRPTFHATLRHYCPDAKCGALLESGPAEDEQEDGEDDDEREVATDGGEDLEDALAAPAPSAAPQEAQEAEDASPHQHTSVWSAAYAVERHEDGSAPRIGVEYEQKNHEGTNRKAGTVCRVTLTRDERGRQVPRITFQRDDGQLMYVEPDGLYTSGSHAPFVGHVQRLTVSTTATTALPSR